MLILKLAFLWHADVQTCQQPWLTPESYRPLMWLSPQSMVGQLLEWPGGWPAPWNWTPGKGTPLSKGVLLSSKQNWVWGLKLSWNLQFHHLQKALNCNWHQWVPPPWGTLYFKKKKVHPWKSTDKAHLHQVSWPGEPRLANSHHSRRTHLSQDSIICLILARVALTFQMKMLRLQVWITCQSLSADKLGSPGWNCTSGLPWGWRG